jgi:pimeloyl-ACP methyl ester carboxylesterase
MGPRDPVEEAGLESFPASDPPAWGKEAEQQSGEADTDSTSGQPVDESGRADPRSALVPAQAATQSASTRVRASRRTFLCSAAASIAGVSRSSEVRAAAPVQGRGSSSFEVASRIQAGVLDVAYHALGPAEGPPVLLLHGWPYDVHSFVDVAPILASRGCRVIVPHLRGHGPTRFLDPATPRSGQQAAIGLDVIALMDSLRIRRAVLAGYDWGGRAACVAAALWPDRCAGLVSVNGYLVQDIAKAGLPAPATVEAAFWYQFYFLTERGRAGLTANRSDIARLMWTRNSPTWQFDESTFLRSAAAFQNPDYVDVVIHSYRHRLGHADGYPEYSDIEHRLAARPTINVPSITLDGDSDGVVPATDGKASADRFSVDRQHRVIAGAGHNLPQEAPDAFAAAVWELASRRAQSSPVPS